MTNTSYTIQQAADLHGVSTRTIRRLISRGELRAYRVGERLIRIRREDLDALGRRIPAVSR